MVVVIGITGFTASRQLSTIDQLPLKENTKYRIYRKIDLMGDTLTIPQGCILAFRGGTIFNGTIVFDSTIINGHPRFRDCKYYGSIKISKIDDRDFTSPDDNSSFVFLFSNAVDNGVKCDFYRDYRISMEGVNNNGLMLFQNIDSGAKICFHNVTIFNTYVFPTPTNRPVIVLKNVKNVTITDCFFRDVDEHNSHRFKKSKGCSFIQCFGDCECINVLNCKQENGDCILRSGVFCHEQSAQNNTPSLGLTNSTISVKSVNTGYGLALYCGDSLDIDIEVDSPHRGFYCAGVSNSTIKYKGYNPIETRCHILIKDAVYKRRCEDGVYSLDMKGCNNLVIRAFVDELLEGEKLILFQSYGSGRKENVDFRFRTGICHHHDIDFSASIKHFPPNGNYYICSVYSDSGALDVDDMYGCKVSNVLIHDINSISGKSNKCLCLLNSFTEAEINFKNCTIDKVEDIHTFGGDIQVEGNSKGIIRLTDCNVGNIYVRDKESGMIDFYLNNTSFDGKTLYTKANSSQGLVRLFKN